MIGNSSIKPYCLKAQKLKVQYIDTKYNREEGCGGFRCPSEVDTTLSRNLLGLRRETWLMGMCNGIASVLIYNAANLSTSTHIYISTTQHVIFTTSKHVTMLLSTVLYILQFNIVCVFGGGRAICGLLF